MLLSIGINLIIRLMHIMPLFYDCLFKHLTKLFKWIWCTPFICLLTGFCSVWYWMLDHSHFVFAIFTTDITTYLYSFQIVAFVTRDTAHAKWIFFFCLFLCFLAVRGSRDKNVSTPKWCNEVYDSIFNSPLSLCLAA